MGEGNILDELGLEIFIDLALHMHAPEDNPLPAGDHDPNDAAPDAEIHHYCEKKMNYTKCT